MSKFVQWWRENPDRAEAVRARRRERLQTDPDAAAAHRQRCRIYYEQKKAESAGSKGARGSNKPKFFWLDGVAVEHWGVVQSASFLEVSSDTFGNWAALGVLPPAVTDQLGRRWWPAAFVQRLPHVISSHKAVPSIARLKIRVSREWEDFQQESRSVQDNPTDDDPCDPLDQEAG